MTISVIQTNTFRRLKQSRSKIKGREPFSSIPNAPPRKKLAKESISWRRAGEAPPVARSRSRDRHLDMRRGRCVVDVTDFAGLSDEGRVAM